MTRFTHYCRVDLLDSMGSDLTVVNAARVSFAKESYLQSDGTLSERDKSLIRYLARNGHWTPFAQVIVQLRIACPIFTARQWFRHTIGGQAVENEVSRRYVSDEPEFFVPETIRSKPDGSIKQGSGGEHPRARYWQTVIEEHFQHVDRLYAKMIADEVAPEQARILLPTAHMTEFYQTASLAFFARVVLLRLDSHAQSEVQDLAVLVSDAISGIAPVSWQALLENQ